MCQVWCSQLHWYLKYHVEKQTNAQTNKHKETHTTTHHPTMRLPSTWAINDQMAYYYVHGKLSQLPQVT